MAPPSEEGRRKVSRTTSRHAAKSCYSFLWNITLSNEVKSEAAIFKTERARGEPDLKGRHQWHHIQFHLSSSPLMSKLFHL